MQNETWKECGDLETLDEAWEEISSSPSGEIKDFPFQHTLFQFLDSHAPLPGVVPCCCWEGIRGRMRGRMESESGRDKEEK